MRASCCGGDGLGLSTAAETEDQLVLLSTAYVCVCCGRPLAARSLAMGAGGKRLAGCRRLLDTETDKGCDAQMDV